MATDIDFKYTAEKLGYKKLDKNYFGMAILRLVDDSCKLRIISDMNERIEINRERLNQKSKRWRTRHPESYASSQERYWAKKNEK